MKRHCRYEFGCAVLAVLLLAGLAQPVALAQPATPDNSRSLAGVTPLPLTGERRAAFEAYLAAALPRFGIPGAAVAVVQGGDVVYLNGFGVTAAGSTQPVTPDTMMMIGSITKSMTTMLAAGLVDDGRLTWDTRLVDLLPDFAVADPALTERLIVRDAFCNCAGLPGADIGSYFAGRSQTAAEVVAELAAVGPTAPYGEQFQYTNLLIAAGGYALGAVSSGATSDLDLAYDTALRERVLGPVGMTRSTFDAEAVLAAGNYALPHAVDLSGDLQQLTVLAERFVWPVRPAGGLWSNAREMARYLQTELARGVAPNGTRVVSAANLEETWAPGIVVPNLFGGPPQVPASMSRYGLGWMSGDYHGLRVIDHAGGTSGFTAEVAFLPEADLGIVILTNAFTLAPFPLAFQYAVQFRLWELLFDQPAEFDAALAESVSPLPQVTLGTVDPATVAPYLGQYVQPQLGEATLSLRGERLIFDTGAFSSELRPRADSSGEGTTYLLHDPPLSLYSAAYGATVTLTGAAVPRLILTIPANATGPERTYEFTPRTG